MSKGGAQPLQATARLRTELRKLQEDGLEGVILKPRENDLLQWDVVIFGPPQTLYEGGYFKLLMRFPTEYPFLPPTVQFLTPMWHPNIYEDGRVCVSILLTGRDSTLRALRSYLWSPSQNIRSVLLSVISMLNEPNTTSPANADAARMYSVWRKSNQKDAEYENRVRHLVEQTRQEAAHDNVKIPTSMEDYLVTRRTT